MLGVVKVRLVGATRDHALLEVGRARRQFCAILKKVVITKESMGKAMRDSFSLAEAKYVPATASATSCSSPSGPPPSAGDEIPRRRALGSTEKFVEDFTMDLSINPFSSGTRLRVMPAEMMNPLLLLDLKQLSQLVKFFQSKALMSRPFQKPP